METDVLTRREGEVGRITLNRPKALNALSLPMVRAIDAALDGFETDRGVCAVLLDGAGERGFCAGGDIRALWDSAREGTNHAAGFWSEEYRLNSRIARFPKPIVAVMHGITMGGGIGLGAHAAHRVVTENSVLAMPETNIGFIPDVGGTYLLSRAPGELGTHLALTAGRANAADSLAAGLADIFVPAARVPDIAGAIAGARTHDAVRAALARLAGEAGASSLAAGRRWIDDCYEEEFDARAILRALDKRPEAGAREAAAAIRRNSPRSVQVTLRALRRARNLADLEDCLAMEFRLAVQCTRQPDFIEGIRAAVVDKDRAPRWSPASLDALDSAEIDRYFAATAETGAALAT